MLKKRFLLSLLAISLLTTTCYQVSAAEKVYRQSETGHARNVDYGVVKHVRAVKIEQDNESGYFSSVTSAGSLGGALAGGVAGSAIGKGNGRKIMTALGAITGSIAGQQLQKKLNTIDGQELEILKEDGTAIVTVQAGTQFSPGQRVAISGGYGHLTVSRR